MNTNKQVKKLLGKDMVAYYKNKIERRYTASDTEKQYDMIVSLFNENCTCRLKPWNEVEVWNSVHFLIYCNIFFDQVLKDKTRPIKHGFKCLGFIQEYVKYLNSGFFEEHEGEEFEYDGEKFSYQTLKDAICFVIEKAKEVLKTSEDFDNLKANMCRMSFGYDQGLFTGKVSDASEDKIMKML